MQMQLLVKFVISLFLAVSWLWRHEVNKTMYLRSPSKLIWIVYMVAQRFKKLNRCKVSWDSGQPA